MLGVLVGKPIALGAYDLVVRFTASCGEQPHPERDAAEEIDASRAAATAPTDQPPVLREGIARPPRFLRLPDVKARTGMSRSTIYNRIRDEQFPAPRNLGGNISAWLGAEVDRWIEVRRDRVRQAQT